LGLLEQLRAETKQLWETSSSLHSSVDRLLRELANPNLHDISSDMPFRVELWDRVSLNRRWVVAATSTVTLGHAAFDGAIANWPDQRFTLRHGIRLISEHNPLGTESCKPE
jgi:hypothetical protein